MSLVVNKTQNFYFGGISPFCSMRCMSPMSVFGFGYNCCNPFGMFRPMFGCFNPWMPMAGALGFCLGMEFGPSIISGIGKGLKKFGNWAWNGIKSIFTKKKKSDEVQADNQTQKDSTVQKDVAAKKDEAPKKDEAKLNAQA